MEKINKYENGKIYRIISHKTNDVYIGSTTQSLYERLNNHKDSCKRYLNKKQLYCPTSYDILKYDDAHIELIEDYKCNSKKELEKKEGEYIRINDCINKNVAGRTGKNYYDENKEKVLTRHKKWRENNQEYMKQYRIKNREKNIEYQKQRRNEEKESISCFSS